MPKFAEGGIVRSPTIGLIGEKGYSEAVIPLTKRHMEKIGIGGAARPTIINMTVNATDAGSFRRSEGQIAASLSRAMAAAKRNM